MLVGAQVVDPQFAGPGRLGALAAAEEQDVVGHHDRGGAADAQQAGDVLDEVELLVAGGGPEVVALVAVHELLDEPLQLRRVLHSVADRAEHNAQHVVARAEFFEDRAVVPLQLDARAPQQRRPVEASGHHPLAT